MSLRVERINGTSSRLCSTRTMVVGGVERIRKSYSILIIIGSCLFYLQQNWGSSTADQKG